MLWAQQEPGIGFLAQSPYYHNNWLYYNSSAEYSTAASIRTSSSGPWDAPNARFNEWAYPYILNVPTIVIAFVLLVHCLQYVESVRRLCSPFIQETVPRERQGAPRVFSFPVWTVNLVFLLLFSCVGLSLSITSLILRNDQLYLSAVPWAAATALLAFTAPKTTSYGLLAVFSTLLASRFIVFLNAHRAGVSRRDVPELLETVAAGLVTIQLLCMPMRDPEKGKQDIAQRNDKPTDQLRSPEDDLALWNWSVVWWMQPLVRLGRTRQLNNEDVWKLPYEFQHHRLHEMFRALKGSVIARLVRANWPDLLTIMFLGAFSTVLEGISPLIFQGFLRSMGKADKWPAIVYGVLELLQRIGQAQAQVFNLWISRRAYERSRGEMIAMLYEKALTRKIINATSQQKSQEETNGNGVPKKKRAVRRMYDRLARLFGACFSWNEDGDDDDDESKNGDNLEEEQAAGSASSGKILNLMKSDAYEIAQRFWEIDELVIVPLEIIIAVLMIWKILGWPCLLGALVIIVTQVLNGLIIKQMVKWEKRRRHATDKKLQKISQFIHSIRHLRWEGAHLQWMDQILEARQKELVLRVIAGVWKLFLTFFNEMGDDAFPVVSFMAYTVISHKELRVDVAFPAIDLFINLQYSLMRVPEYVTTYMNAYVAMKRIEGFMGEPDLEPLNEKPSGHLLPSHEIDTVADVTLENATFQWPGLEHREPVLRNVNAAFGKGLSIIRGKIGSGKSALLQSIIGELDHIDGRIIKDQTTNFGYCAQTPWLQNMSIRNNILFSTDYHEIRYKQVLDACALTHDLANFKHGDLSEIGENGIGLSGGQKARVALARAVYSTAPVLLLDDPLSALDLQTAQHVVRKLLAGPLLEHRTVVLVTHRVELCRDLSYQILEVSGGTLTPESRTSDSDEDVAEEIDVDKDTKQLERIDSVNESDRKAAVPDKFIEDEHRAQGGVKFHIYWDYIKAGNPLWSLLLVASVVVARLLFTSQDWFLKQWGEAYDLQSPSDRANFFGIHLPPPQYSLGPWLFGFFLLGFLGNIAYLMVRSCMLLIVYTAGRKLFRDAIKRVTNSTWRFYDVTPAGRLMNRMTSDISTIDGNLSEQIHDVAWDIIVWGLAIVIIAMAAPPFLVFSVVVALLFAYTFYYFLPTSQSLRRLEMVSLSPLMSNFGTLVEGITTIRAFKVQHEFQSRVLDSVDMFQKHDHFYWTLQGWLMWRLDMLSALAYLVLVLMAIYLEVSPGLAAFLMVNGQRLTRATREMCQDYGKVQMDFVSVERVIELLELEQEDPGSLQPPASWPTYPAEIVFEDVSIRYAPHMDLALKNVSLTIPAGKNTAIIGRTGSGKSTLASSILATVVSETGSIKVQGIDVSKVDKQTLRRRVTFLPQDPLLLPGTMRHNLDHLDEFSDDACAAVLARVGGQYGWTLETAIDDGGKNLSQGQRQLVGLARAVLRQSAIVIFDEATASVDGETALQLARILREELRQSTIITIAHRLETVNADWYIELDNGRVVWEGATLERSQI